LTSGASLTILCGFDAAVAAGDEVFIYILSSNVYNFYIKAKF
jgi:hypothetical protein